MAVCLIEDRTVVNLFSMQNSMAHDQRLTTSMATDSPFISLSTSHCTLVNRKRKLSLTQASSERLEITTNLTDNSCVSQAVPSMKTNQSNSSNTKMKIFNLLNSPQFSVSKRPNSLFLSSTTAHLPTSTVLRTCLSQPPTSTNPINSPNLTSCQFSSLPNIFPLPIKRLYSTNKCSTIELSDERTSPSSNSSLSFITASELAKKIEENHSLMIFDCGSSLRHSEKRIRGATLFEVANRISRKRFKAHRFMDSIISSEAIKQNQSMVLYDDHTNSSCLSSGLQFAFEEIRRLQIDSHSPIYILNGSFEHFAETYPNLCESIQVKVTGSSTMNQYPLTTSSATTTYSLLSSERILTNHDIEHLPMTHIIDGLFIGSESNAKNLEELAIENIRRIVNVTSNVPLYHTDQFEYCHIPADDTQRQNLLKYFDEAYDFIHRAIENKEKVLVHCVAGISRSPAIVIGFLMRYSKMTMDEAYDFVKLKRPIVSPNLNFMGQLLKYERTLQHARNEDLAQERTNQP